MFKKSIALKLTAGFMLIVVIAMMTTGIFFIQMFRQYAFYSKQVNMISRANEIAGISGDYLGQGSISEQYKTFIKILDSFAGARIWVTDNKGNILAMTGGSNVSHITRENMPPQSDMIIQEVLLGNTFSTQGFNNINNEAMLTVGVPFYDKEKNIGGAVILHAPVTGVTETVDRAFNFLMIGIGIALLISLILGNFYSRIFTRALKSMNQLALEMVKGNYTIRTNVRQKDEIGQLSNSLDLLASKLGITIDKLHLEKSKLNDIIASISEGLLAFDTNMKLINYNPAVEKLLNISQEDNIENHILEKLENIDLISLFKIVLLNGETSTSVVDVDTQKLKFFLSPVKDNHGNIIGIVAIIHDISESERLEQLRKDFVANVSHEFRTPLTLIRGSAEAIIDGTVIEKSEMDKYMTRILGETKALENIVKDLLDLSLLQSGKINLNIDNLDINLLLKDVVKGMQILAASKNIKILLRSLENIPPFLGDYDRIRQLFVIFIDNSIKYSPENTEINIRMQIDEKLHIFIQDQGFGIPKEDLPYIWDRFYKAEKSRSGKYSGTGLGLSIAKLLIELHQGSVSVSSTLKLGTTIKLDFPIADSSF